MAMTHTHQYEPGADQKILLYSLSSAFVLIALPCTESDIHIMCENYLLREGGSSVLDILNPSQVKKH